MATRMGKRPDSGRRENKAEIRGKEAKAPSIAFFTLCSPHLGEMCYNHYIISCAGPGGPQGRGAAAENGRSPLLRPKAGDLRAKGPAP